MSRRDGFTSPKHDRSMFRLPAIPALLFSFRGEIGRIAFMTGHALILGLMLLLSALVTPFFGNLHGSDLAILITTVVVGSAFMITALALYFWPTLALGAKRARSLGVPLPFAFAIALSPTVALMTALFLGVATSLDQRPLMATVGVLNSIVFLTLCMWPPQPRTPQSYQARSERSIKAKAPAGPQLPAA